MKMRAPDPFTCSVGIGGFSLVIDPLTQLFDVPDEHVRHLEEVGWRHVDVNQKEAIVAAGSWCKDCGEHLVEEGAWQKHVARTGHTSGFATKPVDFNAPEPAPAPPIAPEIPAIDEDAIVPPVPEPVAEQLEQAIAEEFEPEAVADAAPESSLDAAPGDDVPVAQQIEHTE